MNDSNAPADIADRLVQEVGLDNAIQAAVEAVQHAHDRRDNFRLSIWREVKRILRDRNNG